MKIKSCGKSRRNEWYIPSALIFGWIVLGTRAILHNAQPGQYQKDKWKRIITKRTTTDNQYRKNICEI